jgi:ribonuclease D
MFEQISFPGKIHFICNDSDLQSIAESLNSAKVLGFDTETRPSFKKGEVYKVALLQLSTDTDAYVIRLHKISQFECIQSVFENEDIIKVGAAIRDDIKQLHKAFNFTPNNFVELQDLAKKAGLKNFGLKGMTEEVLLHTITKGPKMTNWEASELTDRQILYAATDAWIGFKLYHKLIAVPDQQTKA